MVNSLEFLCACVGPKIRLGWSEVAAVTRVNNWDRACSGPRHLVCVALCCAPMGGTSSRMVIMEDIVGATSKVALVPLECDRGFFSRSTSGRLTLNVERQFTSGVVPFPSDRCSSVSNHWYSQNCLIALSGILWGVNLATACRTGTVLRMYDIFHRTYCVVSESS